MKLYLHYFSIHVRSAMQYKTSFLLTVLGQFLASFSVFLGIYFMFNRFSSVAGYTYNEVLVCFAVVLIAFSIAECFVRGFDTFTSVISNGEFDRIMVRPRGEMFQVLAAKLELSRVGRLLQGMLVFAYALPMGNIVWTWDKIVTLLLMIAGGVALFSGLFIIYASFCFFTIEGLEFMNIFTDGGREFGRYPLGVYGKRVLGFFTYIVPFACAQYYPFLYLIGRTDNPLHMLAPLGCFLFLVPCFAFWRFGVRRYKSTGS